jgi:hypothetical protein
VVTGVNSMTARPGLRRGILMVGHGWVCPGIPALIVVTGVNRTNAREGCRRGGVVVG